MDNISTVEDNNEANRNIDLNDWHVYICKVKKIVQPDMYISRDVVEMINKILLKVQSDVSKIAYEITWSLIDQILNIRIINYSIKKVLSAELAEKFGKESTTICNSIDPKIINSDGHANKILNDNKLNIDENIRFLAFRCLNVFHQMELNDSGIDSTCMVYLAGVLDALCKHLINVAASNIQNTECQMITVSDLMNKIDSDLKKFIN